MIRTFDKFKEIDGEVDINESKNIWKEIDPYGEEDWELENFGSKVKNYLDDKQFFYKELSDRSRRYNNTMYLIEAKKFNFLIYQDAVDNKWYINCNYNQKGYRFAERSEIKKIEDIRRIRHRNPNHYLHRDQNFS